MTDAATPARASSHSALSTQHSALNSPRHALDVALDANAAAYRRAVQTSAPGDCWDFLILTATNEKQAEGYRAELKFRERATGPAGAFFPAIQKSVVVSDPPGPRIGSGGATLNVLRALVRDHNVDPRRFNDLRILLIHSGGLSQRLPAYSPVGKIFAPLPLLRPDAQIATLFDHLYVTLAGLPERLGPGMLALAGDVFLLFDHRHVTLPAPGVSALSMRVDPETARAHGVFVTDPQHRITRTLQKVSPEEMARHGATDAHGRVLIDTGLLFFDPDSTTTLAKLAGVTPKGKPGAGLHEKHDTSLDLYEEIAGAIATGADAKSFATPLRKELYKALKSTPFTAQTLDGEFLHLGTTRQFREAMVGHNPSPAAELFQQNLLTHTTWPLESGRRVYHSALLPPRAARGTSVPLSSCTGHLAPGCVVEHSVLYAPTSVGEGSVVSQVSSDRPLRIAPARLLFQVPVRTGATSHFVHVYCGTDDDFKGAHADGKCRYLNAPIADFLTRTGITANDLWRNVPEKDRTLWTARIFVATPDRNVPDVAIAITADGKVPKRTVDAWRKSPRYSMSMILDAADPVAMIEHRETVAAHLQAYHVLDAVRRREDAPVAESVGHYATVAAHAAAESVLTAFANGPAPDAHTAVDQARALWSAAQVLQRPDHPDPDARTRVPPLMTRAFRKIAEASEIGYRSIRVTDDAPGKLRPNQAVTATAPVRLDLAGGWTDTPPYCFERGGHVVNLAIDLDGRPPVRAVVRTTKDPRITLTSHDLGSTTVVETIEDHVDVRDPFALHKVALRLVGLAPSPFSGGPQGRVALSPNHHSAPNTFNFGLEITTECRVPKGSGLGTSSILAATLLAALHKLHNHTPTTEDLIEQTLLLEQRLSTGGGWQDQVGGIVGGVKSTLTAPGIPQRPVVEPLPLSDSAFAALEERLVVYYSGQQRLARDILRRVMGRWLAREPACVALMRDLHDNAKNLRAALLKSAWPAAAREVARYWQIKKDLYPGSTTPTTDVMLLELRDLYAAAGLAGAGGGGFAYFLCKDARQAHKLRAALAERSARPGTLGTVYATHINRTGLTVTVE